MNTKLYELLFSSISNGAKFFDALDYNASDKSIKKINDELFEFLERKNKYKELSCIPDSCICDLITFVASHITKVRRIKNHKLQIKTKNHYMYILNSYLKYLKFESSISFTDNNYFRKIIIDFLSEADNYEDCVFTEYDFSYVEKNVAVLDDDLYDISDYMTDMFTPNTESNLRFPITDLYYGYCLYNDVKELSIKNFTYILEDLLNLNISYGKYTYVSGISLTHKGTIFFDFVYPASKKITV